MKDEFEVVIGPDGVIKMMYQDGVEKFAEELGGDVSSSCRASDVEWEEIGDQKGWTVRSAKNKALAFRTFPVGDGKIHEFKLSDDESKPLMFFEERWKAIFHETVPKNFWQLMKGELNKGE